MLDEDKDSVQRVLSVWESSWHFGHLQAPLASSKPSSGQTAASVQTRPYSLPVTPSVQHQEHPYQREHSLPEPLQQQARAPAAGFSPGTSRLQARSVRTAARQEAASRQSGNQNQEYIARASTGSGSSFPGATIRHRARLGPASHSYSYQPRGHSHRHLSDNLQDAVDTLMDAYMSMLPRQPPTPFEQPKGVNKLFVKLVCRPASWLNLQASARVLIRLVTGLCFLLVHFSVVLVPAWLWLLHNDIQHHGGWINAQLMLHVVVGMLMFVGADMLMQRSLRRAVKASQEIVTAATVAPLVLQEQARLRQLQSMMPKVAGSAGQPSGSRQPPAAVSRPPGTGSQHHATAAGNNRGAQQAQHAPGLSTTAAAAGQQQHHHAGGAHHGGTASEWHEVRLALIQLQRDVYGVEQTEGLLPVEAVHSQAQTLCSDLGVAWPQREGHLPPQTILEMLKQARKEAGFDV